MGWRRSREELLVAGLCCSEPGFPSPYGACCQPGPCFAPISSFHDTLCPPGSWWLVGWMNVPSILQQLLHSGFLCGGFLSWLLSSVCFKQSPKEGAASAPGKDTCQTPGELRAAAREIKQPLTSCRMCPGLKLLFPSAFRLVPQLLVLICAEQGGVCS